MSDKPQRTTNETQKESVISSEAPQRGNGVSVKLATGRVLRLPHGLSEVVGNERVFDGEEEAPLELRLLRVHFNQIQQTAMTEQTRRVRQTQRGAETRHAKL